MLTGFLIVYVFLGLLALNHCEVTCTLSGFAGDRDGAAAEMDHSSHEHGTNSKASHQNHGSGEDHHFCPTLSHPHTVAQLKPATDDAGVLVALLASVGASPVIPSVLNVREHSPPLANLVSWTASITPLRI